MAPVLIIVGGAIFLIWLVVVTNNIAEEPATNNKSRASSQSRGTEARLERPEDGTYDYFNLVGMKYRNLTNSDYGIHEGVAVAETNNRHDPNAVSIRYSVDGKVLAYVPMTDNEELHALIAEDGGSVPARFKIWTHDGEVMYGIAYIRTGR